MSLTRTITWIPVTESLPDDELTVLIVYDGEVVTGFTVAGLWHDVLAWPLDAELVTHWADFPEVPA